MRSRVTMVLAVAAIVLGGVLLVPAAYARLSVGGRDDAAGGDETVTDRTPSPPPPPPPTLAPAEVSVNFTGEFFSWALIDRQTGKINGAKNMSSTSSTESMIKAWIVSDYLRRLGEKQPSASLLKQASLAILDSNDDAANRVYYADGGSYKASPDGRPNRVIQRAITICGLTDTKRGSVPGYQGYWSFTQMSPRDAVRLGDCIADGKAAGPKWTKWVLDQMRKVRGSVTNQQARQGGGRWGIIDGLPATITAQGPISIKNGWTRLNYDGNWHVNCLAVNSKWSLAVMMRYPGKYGLKYGAKVCASVASQLVTPRPVAAPNVSQ